MFKYSIKGCDTPLATCFGVSIFNQVLQWHDRFSACQTKTNLCLVYKYPLIQQIWHTWYITYRYDVLLDVDVHEDHTKAKISTQYSNFIWQSLASNTSNVEFKHTESWQIIWKSIQAYFSTFIEICLKCEQSYPAQSHLSGEITLETLSNGNTTL